MKQDKKYTKDELLKKLTEKERIFCHQYIIDWNGARAAREAGYSEKTAREIAYANLTKIYIQQYINYIKTDLEKEAGITKLKQINELKKIAYSNILEIHDTWIDLKDWEYIKSQNPDIMAAVESIETKTEYKTYNKGELSETDVEIKYIKVKFYSKLQALDQINKMMGYNDPKKIDITSNGDTLSKYSDYTLEELNQKIDELQKSINTTD